MSRIGNQPITLPDGVQVTVDAGQIEIKGPKGELKMALPEGVSLTQDGQQVILARAAEDKKAIHGTVRSILDSCVKGVTEGWTRGLEIVGSGYKAVVNGNEVELAMGYSHPVKLAIPEGLSVTVVKNTVTVSGIDRQKVGQFAAIIRAVRKPEPYKGKGIRYDDERVRRKAGKALKSGA